MNCKGVPVEKCLFYVSCAKVIMTGVILKTSKVLRFCGDGGLKKTATIWVRSREIFRIPIINGAIPSQNLFNLAQNLASTIIGRMNISYAFLEYF